MGRKFHFLWLFAVKEECGRIKETENGPVVVATEILEYPTRVIQSRS